MPLLFPNFGGTLGGGGPEAIQAMTDETAGRAFETSYENTSGHDLFVLIFSNGNDSISLSEFALQTSPDNSTWTTVGKQDTQTDVNQFVVFGLVPEGHYYRLTQLSGPNTAAGVNKWWEQIQGGGPSGGSGVQPFTDETASRALLTTYQNTTGHDMLVLLSEQGNNDGDVTQFVLEVSPDNSTWTWVSKNETQTDINWFQLSGLVPDGYYYRTRRQFGSQSAYGLLKWWEQLQGGGSGIKPMVDETASRALETSYQNTSGGPRLVLVSESGNNDTSLSIYQAQTSPDGATWTEVGRQDTADDTNRSGTHEQFQLAFVVPDTYYYRVTQTLGANSAETILGWWEQDAV